MTEYRVALVTGGAYGIGRGIAQELAKKGNPVVIACEGYNIFSVSIKDVEGKRTRAVIL